MVFENSIHLAKMPEIYLFAAIKKITVSSI